MDGTVGVHPSHYVQGQRQGQISFLFFLSDDSYNNIQKPFLLFLLPADAESQGTAALNPDGLILLTTMYTVYILQNKYKSKQAPKPLLHPLSDHDSQAIMQLCERAYMMYVHTQCIRDVCIGA